MDYIRMLRQYGREFSRPLDEAEACVLQSALEWALGQKKEAVSTMVTALLILQPYSFIRVTADEGASVLPVLKRIQASLVRQKSPDGNSGLGGIHSEDEARVRAVTEFGGLSLPYVSEVVLATYSFSKGRRGITSNIKQKNKPIKLSKQQEAMILLLAQGYRATAMADITGRSLSTVKSHLAAAYRKLEVNNAMDAVIRARELGLIKQENNNPS